MNRQNFKAVCVIAMLWLAIAPAYAQPFRKLTVDDFTGVPRPNGRGVVAYTNCTLDFKFQGSRRDNNTYMVHFNVRLFMNNNKSWIDRARIAGAETMADILNHEQGHYNIAYLEQQEVIRAMQRTRFSANYQAEAMNIFNTVDAKYKQLNIDYDEDTQHSINRQQQHSWDIYFAKRIEFMPHENASL